MTDYISLYPRALYGYAITVYKSQGSEWRTVYINLSSIYYCLLGRSLKSKKQITMKHLRQLFQATYTALTRASADLRLFWFTRD